MKKNFVNLPLILFQFFTKCYTTSTTKTFKFGKIVINYISSVIGPNEYCIIIELIRFRSFLSEDFLDAVYNLICTFARKDSCIMISAQFTDGHIINITETPIKYFTTNYPSEKLLDEFNDIILDSYKARIARKSKITRLIINFKKI
jgi:hypothetical protein